MKVLLLNVHSALNLGDDAIMRVTLDGLRTAFPGVQITVSANDPGSWAKYHDIRVVSSLATWVADPAQGRWRERLYRMPFVVVLLSCAAVLYRFFGIRLMWGAPQQRHLLAAYYDADLVLSCGGGNFYAHRKLSPALIWALVSLVFAIVLGKQIVMLPQSFGPIVGSLQRLFARWTFARVRLIMVREPRAGAFIREVLQVKTPVLLMPDLAFGLSSRRRPENSTGSMLTYQIGVTALDRSAQEPGFSGQQRYEEALVTLLMRLACQYDAQIHVFCQCFGPSPDQDDRPVAKRLDQRLRQLGVATALRVDFRDACEIVSAYSELDLVIGTRMHTGVFALSTGVPVLLIGYQPKACGMMKTLGLERYCCDIRDVNADVLYELACEILARKEELHSYILERLEDIRLRAQAWIEPIKEIVCDASA